MPDSSGDDHDSRTASVGRQRKNNSSNKSSRHASQEPPTKRQRRNRNTDLTPDVQDFVPQGATFSANSLDVDPDDTSSSGSDSSDSDSDRTSDDEPTTGSAPVVNWNKGNKSAIRTSLGSRRKNSSLSSNNEVATSQFEAVNGKFWRSRSASASPGSGGKIDDTQSHNQHDQNDGGDDHEKEKGRDSEDDDMEEGEVDENAEEDDDSSEASSQSHLSGDSDDSESLDSEADDSILLNIGSRGHNQRALSPSDEDEEGGEAADSDDNKDYDPEDLSISQNSGKENNLKEDALNRFAQKYPTAPAVLADLERADMDVQAQAIYYDRDINSIDLQLPVTCTECLREGHLAEVCPMKECVHCGAWSLHQSSFCPKWRRCQRCRERGHDEKQCTSALKGSSSDVPCDLCGSSEHLEFECDFMWKLPRPDTTAAPVIVSLSCAHCTSNSHLMGDCPSLQRPLASSSFTIRGIDPNLITDIKSVANTRNRGPPPPPPRGGQRGMKIRGRADQRSPSPESDDMMPRPGRAPVNRNANRGNIRFGNGIGKNRNLGPPPGGRDNYRDREDYSFRNNGRERSMSPRPRSGPGRGRGKDSYQPQRGPSRPPTRPARGGGDRGRRGGRGGHGNGDPYRPLPSAAKKAWDKYRLS